MFALFSSFESVYQVFARKESLKRSFHEGGRITGRSMCDRLADIKDKRHSDQNLRRIYYNSGERSTTIGHGSKGVRGLVDRGPPRRGSVSRTNPQGTHATANPRVFGRASSVPPSAANPSSPGRRGSTPCTRLCFAC